VSTDQLSSVHERDLAQLKQSRTKRLLKLGIKVVGLGVFIILTISSFVPRTINNGALLNAKQEFLSVANSSLKEMVQHQEYFSTWLSRHGTTGELATYTDISTFIFTSLSGYIRHIGVSENPGVFSTIYIGLFSAILKIAFLTLACWRLWLVVIAFTAYKGWQSWKVHVGPDILGDTGNGRLFYSGIRAGLDDLNAEGIPNNQVVGLACPKQVASQIVDVSELGQLLKRYKVDNAANMALAGIILAYSDYPAYVASIEQESLLNKFIFPAKLAENATAILERVLDLHAFYAHGQSDADFLEYLEQFDNLQAKQSTITYEQYSKNLQKAFHRVLTPQMRQDLAKLSAEKIATIILAYEAGKTMAFGFAGGKWLRVSNYSQLTARSILHSVSAYVKGYNYTERSQIRHALIFASRQSYFGPIKLPNNICEESRAARQWVELLMACPHNLEAVANDVEMYGIICESHKKWKEIFLNKVVTAQVEVTQGVYATQGNLFLMPISQLMSIARECLSSKDLRRLNDLSVLVGQQQRLDSMVLDNSSDDSSKGNVPAYAKVLQPFTDQEVLELSTRQGIKPELIKEWSSFRLVLNQFGWLARRVGDYSVPENSLILAVLRPGQGHPDSNQFGRIGAPGMVPLRGTHLEEKWGKNWQNRFNQVLDAAMAQTLADYEKLMRGEEKDESDDVMVGGV
jgi:hypothetical protein